MKSRKWIIFVLAISAIVVILLYKNNFTSHNNLSNKIIEYIDNNCDNNTCRFTMNNVTNFKWDKMLIYQVGSSNKEISDLLGVQFQDSLDLASGIIFVYKNKIIYKEQLFYNPEKPFKLLLSTGAMYGQTKYGVFTPTNAFFKGRREKSSGNMFYEIEPIN